MIYLHNILPKLFSPLMFFILIIFLGIIFNSRKITFCGIIILIFFSLPIVSKKLIQTLEIDYQPTKISEINNADAIVVLSGMTRSNKNIENIDFEFNEAVDRIIAGIKLFKIGKAPTLILTGGKLPWSIGKPEGEYLKEFAINNGIPEKDILITENVQNTDQEARSIKKLLPEDDKKIILVTSAFHMVRAVKVFEAANISLIPFPVDYKQTSSTFTSMDLIPSAYSLYETYFFMREMIGRFYYNLKY